MKTDTTQSRKSAINPDIDTQHHLNEMLTCDKNLYERILDTMGFAYNFGQITLRAMAYEDGLNTIADLKRALAAREKELGEARELNQEAFKLIDRKGMVLAAADVAAFRRAAEAWRDKMVATIAAKEAGEGEK